MAHKPKAYPLEGKLTGISDNQLAQHRDTLYVGYVNKLNEIEAKLQAADRSAANATYSEFRALKAEESFALNGVVLHELYFGNLGGAGGRPKGVVADAISREFGSFESWEADFKACGKSARGWVFLAWSFFDEKLHNYTTDAHHLNFPIAATPLLVMDVYEHAYMIDYGVNRAKYIDAFMNNIDWEAVGKRLQCSAIHPKK